MERLGGGDGVAAQVGGGRRQRAFSHLSFSSHRPPPPPPASPSPTPPSDPKKPLKRNRFTPLFIQTSSLPPAPGLAGSTLLQAGGPEPLVAGRFSFDGDEDGGAMVMMVGKRARMTSPFGGGGEKGMSVQEVDEFLAWEEAKAPSTPTSMQWSDLEVEVPRDEEEVENVAVAA
ncbi:hypothetical protein HDU67_003190, partial [Dinochytrium kinnereticum]